MGFWGALLGREPGTYEAAPNPARRQRFAIGDDYQTWLALTGQSTSTTKVSRAEASRVPAVKRARDLIAGVIGTLPLHAINGAGETVGHALLEQPERLNGLVRCVTVSKTVEDLLYEGTALWLVVLRTSAGFPQVVRRVEHGTWSQDTDSGVIRVNGREVSTEDVILFTSPCDPLLVAGAPAIKNLIRLEATAALYADSPEPSSFFTAADGIDPEDDEEIERLLTEWREARRTRSTAYVPASVKLNSVDRMTAEELQLIEARRFAITEVSRLTGVDPDWLAVPVTSRVYNNMQDSRRSYVDFVLSPYLHAVEERLSLGDVTPRGQRVLFNLDGFLRASTLDRYSAHRTAIEAGFMTVNEVRGLENRAPLEAAE